MKVLQRYFATEIIQAVFFVTLALLALITFFDLMSELRSINQNGYQLQHALLYVLLGIPNNIYDFMPIAVLIGTIYVMAQFAQNSEFTIMRASSMSSQIAAGMLFKIALIFVIATFFIGEIVAPISEKTANKVKLNATGASVTQGFRSGLWAKDLIHQNGVKGAITGSRFFNVKEVLPDRTLMGVKIYEFDTDFHLTKEINAQRAIYSEKNVWKLIEVTETHFPKNLVTEEISSENTLKLKSKKIISEITPDILAVLFIEDPDRMSAYDLFSYTQHLNENKQNSDRYKVAFWKKLTYPLTILVMMALALPFAFLHARNGGISLRIFSGIMIGMFFYIVNSLFSHLGLLNTWPAFLTAIFPSVLFFILAVFGLRYVERN
jgi:lipopolysaccharide export system permease protein